MLSGYQQIFLWFTNPIHVFFFLFQNELSKYVIASKNLINKLICLSWSVQKLWKFDSQFDDIEIRMCGFVLCVKCSEVYWEHYGM